VDRPTDGFRGHASRDCEKDYPGADSEIAARRGTETLAGKKCGASRK
jgi:hypothetical protein